MGGRSAKQYVYTVTFGEVTHKQMQVLVQAPDADMYVFTYTATPERFNDHLDDVALILESFRFE